MKKYLTIILAICTMLCLSACGGDENIESSGGAASGTTVTDSETGVLTTVLSVEGMTCGNCVRAVTGELTVLDGVIDVSVNLRDGKVTVEHDSDVTIDDIKDGIMNAGYTPFD